MKTVYVCDNIWLIGFQNEKCLGKSHRENQTPLYVQYILSKNCNVEKYGRARQATEDNIMCP